ncbi:DUF4199 domain-containing protein [Xanthovirga aplysinae]|uniref:DUF4199 domain-containing protein n=1 Tax=Xanthovirga aplysinae TaxID=2529853 RepID=UPI0012BCD7E4|nr:DUF4199 domain-containing protein [Xanthovirga aplysinae]MTI32535.1 DUF4199 domain-containing protein [Xanthovirga aplysinae]
MSSMHPLVKVAIKYGLIGALISIVPFLTLYFSNISPVGNPSSVIVDFLLMLVFIFFANREFRDSKNEGKLRFWQGMSIGFILYCIIGFVYGAFVFIFIKSAGQPFFDMYIQQAAEGMKQVASTNPETISQEQLAQGLEELKNVTAVDLFFKALIGKLFLGLIVTPIVTIVLRK